MRYHAAPWGDGRTNGTKVGLRICSRCLCAFTIRSIKTHPCSLSIRYTCPHITPPPPWAAQSTTLTSAKRSPTRSRTRCHLPPSWKTRIHPGREQLSKVPDAIECEHWPTQVGYANKLRSRTWWGRRACRCASETDSDCAEMLCTPITAVAVWVAGLRPWWRPWRPWSGVVTPGWGWLDVLLTSAVLLTPLRRLIGRDMNLQLTGSSSGGQVNMLTSVTVLSDKTAHFTIRAQKWGKKALCCAKDKTQRPIWRPAVLQIVTKH